MPPLMVTLPGRLWVDELSLGKGMLAGEPFK